MTKTPDEVKVFLLTYDIGRRSMPLEREQRIAPRQHDLGADWLNVQRNGDAIAAVV